MRGANLLLGGAIVAACFMPASDVDARDREARSVRVEYGDLNVEADAGAEVLLNRIERAAARACGANQGRRPLSERAATRACVQQAVDQAVSTIDAPRLTALHFGAASGGEAALGAGE
ncbi:UrcA family protein [Vitreimonas flagellata]|uniref:UrcA family protein n=1 Tax=Vitreimonas flagellata TaxID=2560861 RepID=UPI00142FBCF3|nr:UrcA family protein [Vitreimonas flagellata]